MTLQWILKGRPDVDGSILWEKDIESAFWYTINYIDTCSQNGMVFGQKKFVFGKTVADFVGFTVAEDSIRPSEKLVLAVWDFPTQTNPGYEKLQQNRGTILVWAL